MKLHRIILAAFLLCFIGATSFAATNLTCTSGTATATKAQLPGFTVWTINWTSDAGGYCTVTGGLEFSGRLERVITTPAVAPNVPTSYAVAIKESSGVDLLYGVGTSRSTTASEVIAFLPPTASVFSTSTLVQTVNTTTKFYPWQTPVTGPIGINVTGGGNAKKGSVKIYIRNDP